MVMSDKFKVVLTSNFNLDYFDEKEVVANLSKEGATTIAVVLNKELSAPYSPICYVVKPNDYVLLTLDPNQ